MEFNTEIERKFSECCQEGHGFPLPSVNYVDRYSVLKQWLIDNCYKSIGTATSVEDGGWYTDHGPDHFDKVLKYSGDLLGINDQSNEIPLNWYEIYLLMTGVLLHDAGNVFGRSGHEKRALEILKDVGAAVSNCNIERKSIADLAKVHGGKTKGGSKDTIGEKFNATETDYLGVTYRPKLIASIVRFADEICEDKTRAARYALIKGDIPKKSEAYHYYAESISSSKVDLSSRLVRITFDVDIENTRKKIGKDDGEVYLIDEIFSRIEKMYSELLYCSRFFQGLISVDSIRVIINIRDEDYEDVDTLTIDTHSGYPTESLNLSAKYSSWSGEALSQRLESV